MLTLPSHTNQCGAALIVSMMMLVAITIIGVAVMSNSRLEWLMASNSNLQSSLLARAQTALSTGESNVPYFVCGVVSPPSAAPTFNCDANRPGINWGAQDQYYNASTTPFPSDPRIVQNWTGGTGGFASANASLAAPSYNPSKYIVIYKGCSIPPTSGLGTCNDGVTIFADIYEVWAFASDVHNSGARIVRSTISLIQNPAGNLNRPIPQRVGYAEIYD